MFAVLAEEDSRLQPIPERFRLSDYNPLVAAPYAECPVGELPPYIEDVITRELGLTAEAWDELVASGRVATVVDLDAEFSLVEFRRSVSERGNREAPASVCGDCWGTLAACDFDGSVTGTVGGAYLCDCAGM
ncbi:hypothetical protein L3Q67_07825 [Saccharothrix sp. AJ9571]|nr:hypothetical protein L3Q67_07825 [Saccharothrix sp. AJ9571]